MKTLFEKMRDNRRARMATAKLKAKQAYEEYASEQDALFRRKVAEAERRSRAIQTEAFWQAQHKGLLARRPFDWPI